MFKYLKKFSISSVRGGGCWKPRISNSKQKKLRHQNQEIYTNNNLFVYKWLNQKRYKRVSFEFSKCVIWTLTKCWWIIFLARVFFLNKFQTKQKNFPTNKRRLIKLINSNVNFEKKNKSHCLKRPTRSSFIVYIKFIAILG